MADKSRTVEEMEAEFAKSRPAPQVQDPVADLEAEYQRARASSKPADLEAEYQRSKPLADRPAPEPVAVQAARGVAEFKPPPDLDEAALELQNALIEYNKWTNHPDPEGDAVAQVAARKKRRSPADKSATITPFGVGEVAERVKAATEPGSIGYRAAEAVAPKWYGSAAQTERRHYWRVAESEADRQLGRVVRQQMLMDQGVPKDAATIRAQAAYELNLPLLVPTQDNPRFSAGPQVDIGIGRVTELKNTLGQGVADIAAGTMDLATEAANLAKDVVVDAPLAIGAGVGRPVYEAVTGKEAPDPSKGLREWSFGSLTEAVADALPESAAKESLKSARERGAGILAGSAEVRNALLAPLGMDPIDPDGDGVFDVVSRLMLTQPREEMPAPTPTGEGIVSSTVENIASVPGVVAQGYEDMLTGKRSPEEAAADTAIFYAQTLTTPAMELFSSVSKDPGAQERESSLGWFLRVPATALSGVVTTQAARVADYWLTRSGATSQRRRRVPGDPALGFWEAHLPVIFTGSGLHDYATTLYNGDSFTSEWMRTADTAATLPGISDSMRSSLLPGGRWREGGTQLAMLADLFVPVDAVPFETVRGAKNVAAGVGEAARASALGMGVKEAVAMGAAEALPASLTHALMMKDAAYRSEWESMAQRDVDAQKEMGVAEPVPFSPDADMVRLATARAYMRKMVDRGLNPVHTEESTPADRKALANSIREQLTMLKVRPEDIEAALAEVTGDGEVVEPAVGSVVPAAEADRLDAREAALADDPPLGTFTEAVTAAATPREKVIAGLEELATAWGMDPADPLVSRAFEAALSFWDAKKGAFRRAPEADEALLNRITDADATRALNRLRDASPAQVMENTKAFVLGAVPRWSDERIPGRARVRSEIIGRMVVDGLPMTVPEIDAFLTVTDRIADALVERGVIPSRDDWYARQSYTSIAPGSVDAERGRGFFQIGNDGRALIGLAQDANLSTLFHENAHLLRRILPVEHMEAVDAYVREQFGGWTVKAEEWFAVQFESVLTKGKISVAKADTITKKFEEALNKALRFAADVLRKVYEGGALPGVNPVFAAWMESFAGLKIEIEPVKADPPVAPPARAKKPGQVVTTDQGVTIPHVSREGWGPALLREAEVRAEAALKGDNKAVQEWLSWVHSFLGEPKDIRAKRHRLAGKNAAAVVEAMLNAGRLIVADMDDAAKAAADTAFAAPKAPEPAPALPENPTKKHLAAAGYKPEGKGAMVHPETGDRYGWSYESKVWIKSAPPVVEGTKAPEPVAATVAPWEAPLAAMSASSSTKDILAAVGPLADALGATKEERASLLAAVKNAVKNKVPVAPVANAFVSTKIRLPADVSPPPAPTLPDVLAEVPEPEPTTIPPTVTMPKAGTLTVDAYGQPRKMVGGVPFSIRKVKLSELVTEGVPPGVADLARMFNVDELDPTGVDPGVGAVTVREVDGKLVVVDGVRRAQALQELYRRGMAGEEPYRSVLAGVQSRTSAWSMGLGVAQALGDEVFVRVVDGDLPAGEPAKGLDVLGALPIDLADAASRAGEPAQARIAAAVMAIASLATNPDPAFQASAPLAALRDGLILYGQVRAAGGPPARWATTVRNRYVAVANAKALPVSAPSVHVAVALGALSPDAFAAWLSGVAAGGPWARTEADAKAVADLPARHADAIEHARRLEMAAIEAAEAEKSVVTEPPGWEPEVGPKGAGGELRQERIDADDPDAAAYGGARTAKGMVAWIAAKGSDPKLRAMARKILPLVPDNVPVRVIQPGRTYMFGPGKENIPQAMHSARGVFRWNTAEPDWAGDITLRGSGFDEGTLGLRDETILHEAIHAVVNRRIYEGNFVATPDGPAKRGTAMFYKINNDLVAWFNDQKRKGTLPDYANTAEFIAAMNSVNELTTYAFTNADVQSAFKQIRLPGERKSLWTRFIEGVRSILGLSADDDSVLARIIDATNVLLEDVLGPDGMPIERPDAIEAVEEGPVRLYQPRQIDTPEFRRWFGNSKVVDEKGRPLVVYHGTPAGEFDVFRVGSEAGAHFGTPEAANDAISAARKKLGLALVSPDAVAAIDWAWSEVRQDPRFKAYMDEADRLASAQETAIDSGDEVAIAKAYADIAEFEESPPPPGYNLATAGVARRLKEARSQFSEGERVIPVYLSIQNPIQLSDPALGAWGSPDMVKITNSHPALNDFVGGSSAQMVEHLQKKGYDGIVYQNKFEGKGSTSYIAFRPTQIKSAIANAGTFDPENPSILRQHRDYVASALPEVPAGSPPPPVPTGDVVSETVGRDQPQVFYGAAQDKEGVATPYGMRAVKDRAIPAYTTPSQLKRALGYRADQTRFNARDLVVRAGAYALLQKSQAKNARVRFMQVGNMVSVPANRVAAVRARALAVLGDLPVRVREAVERRPALAPDADPETQPIGLSLTDAGRIRTLLDALDANGWIDSLPTSVAKMTVTDIAEKMTTEQFRQFHGAVLDAQSGAAPYRGRVDRFALAANLVWEFAQRPGSWFTPAPLPRNASKLDKATYSARSWVGALILSTANYALPWDEFHPDMRPDIRPLYERMRREMSQLPSRLAESLEALMERKHKPASPGAMQAEMEELARSLPGAVPPIGVNPRGDGLPSDLHTLRAWLYRDPPQPYGTATSVDIDGNVVVNSVPHDFPRVGVVDPKFTTTPERPMVDAVAEVIAHEDVLNRVLNPVGRRIDAEVTNLLNQVRNRTIDPDGAALLVGHAYAALNAAREIGVKVLVAAAGHSGAKDKIANVVSALETGPLSGTALDAYEAFYQFRWTRPQPPSPGAPPPPDASIEALVRTLGVAPKTLPAPFWVFDILNHLNVLHLIEEFTDLAIDRNYVFNLNTMTEGSGIQFKDLRDRAMFAMQVKDFINAEMRGTDYVRMYGVDNEGVAEAGVDLDPGTVRSQQARYYARTIMAQIGLRPDVLATRKGYKGEMATSPVVGAWLTLSDDPVKRAEELVNPATYREAGKRLGLHGRDYYMSTVISENLAEMTELHAPLAERLAVVLSNRESYSQFFDRVRDLYAQLKGSFITGGPNGVLAAALVGGGVLAGAAVPQALALGTVAWGMSVLPRFPGFFNNAFGAVLQGVIELGWVNAAKAFGTATVPAMRAAQQSVRFHRVFGALDAATVAVQNLTNPRPPENVTIVGSDGRVYTIADVMTISRRYGLDETQARSESAETIRRKVDRLYETYEADPSFTGTVWRGLASFFGRYKITENYRRMYEMVDVFFRYVWLIRGLQEGLRPEDAVARSLRISFDYTATSQVDRWVNMIGMFWMYQRRALDLTLAALIEHPSTVFGMVRFMRAQDLTSGYADLNEEYERETETVPEYAMGRFGVAYLPVAGARTAAQKVMLVEPPNVTAMKLINDVVTGDPFMVASRANPFVAVGFNVISTTAGGPMVSMFRRSTADSPSQWKVPARFVMLDQALNGGHLTKLFHIVPMYVDDGTGQPSDEMGREFYVGEQGRMLWDAYRSLVPGFSTWLTDVEMGDRGQGWSDELMLEVMGLVEGTSLPERQNYGSVFTPATDVQPRVGLGSEWEKARRLGLSPAAISTPYAAEVRPVFDAATSMKEEAAMLTKQVERMVPEMPEAKELRQPETIKPGRDIGVDPDKPIGLERR